MRAIGGSRLVPFALALTWSVIAANSLPLFAHEPKSVCTSAVEEPTVRITQTQARVFQDTLAAMATQARVAFVAEGAPLRPALPDQAAPTLSQSAPLSVAVEKAVEKLAAAYDYDAERRGNLFVLKKRYSDPHDLPGVTLQECASALADAERLMSPYNPRVSRDSLVARGVIKSLTPQQLQAMHDGSPSVASLSPGQQAQVLRFALYLYVQGSPTIERYASRDQASPRLLPAHG